MALDVLLNIVWLVLCLVLLAFASASTGRKLADIDVMRLRRINGVRNIAARVQLRAQVNRIILALVFGVNGVLGLIDVSSDVQHTVFRVGLILVLSMFTLASIADWRDDREQLRLVVDEYARDHDSGEIAP